MAHPKNSSDRRAWYALFAVVIIGGMAFVGVTTYRVIQVLKPMAAQLEAVTEHMGINQPKE